MAGTVSPAPWLQFADANSNPYAGGKLYTYVAGTSTPATVYTDAALAVPHPNPIILDAAGRTTIFLPATGSFKFVLHTSADVLVRSQDNITSVALSAELIDALTAFREGMIAWPGSDASALMGTAAPAGNTKATRAPGTALLVIATPVTVHFEATLMVEAGGTASVSLYSTGAPNTPITGTTLTSTNADGERIKTVTPVALVAGTYFIKGHSTHASKQAWAIGYRIMPS